MKLSDTTVQLPACVTMSNIEQSAFEPIAHLAASRDVIAYSSDGSFALSPPAFELRLP